MFNPFLANVPILHPLKTPESLSFSGVFRGFKMGTLARNGLIRVGFIQLKYNFDCIFEVKFNFNFRFNGQTQTQTQVQIQIQIQF